MGRAEQKLWSSSSLRGVPESGVGTEGALGVFNAQVSWGLSQVYHLLMIKLPESF